MSADVAPSRRALAMLAIPFMLGGCEWFTDFRTQPAIETWESVLGDSVPQRANPAMSIPTTGVGVPAYVVSYQAMPATIDSMAGLVNPVPVTEESLLNGRKLYQLNCAPCHGPAGRGNGPVVPFGYPGFPLAPAAIERTDGYIYGMIRNGRGVMPSYNRIEDLERWDVVNYIRALQGRVPFAVDTVPLGTPGETGDVLPGATRTAPTRPAPYLIPDSVIPRLPPGARVPWLPRPTRPPAAQAAPTASPPPVAGGGR